VEVKYLLIGYDAWGFNCFQPDLPAVSNISYLSIKNTIVDEVHIRTATDSSVDTTPAKQPWQIDTRLLARFQGNLEAGNVNNEGIPIVKFAIKRRKAGEVNPITIGYVDFVNDSQMKYIDFTQPNGIFIYSVVPVGVNGLQGIPNEVEAVSNFVGWFIVDKDTNQVIAFDKFLSGNEVTVQTKLNQGKVLLESMSKFPQVYYTNQNYHTFNLSGVIVPSNMSFDDYQNVVNLLTQHKPLIVKSSSGDIYVCDVSSPQKTSLLNAFTNYDYYTLEVECVEIMDYNSFISQD
jgi:hypothetical protein